MPQLEPVRYVRGALVKRYGRAANLLANVSEMDDYGFYPATFVKAHEDSDQSVSIQVMRGSRAVQIYLPRTVFDSLPTGEYLTDEP